MSNFTHIELLPRLTPPLKPETIEDVVDLTRKPTPPPRKSIYQHPEGVTWHVNVMPYSPLWPVQFDEIHEHLHEIFTTSEPPALYATIEHIGSTAVPGLAGKPNIDVMVTFASRTDYENASEAMNWEVPRRPPYVRHTQIPRGGGIQGRESFKIYLPENHQYYDITPERNIYLIADTDDNSAGRVQIRCYRTLRDTLQQKSNLDLQQEYSEVKLRLGETVFANGLDYAKRKDDIVRKILLRGGWTTDEVDEKERLSRHDFNPGGSTPPY